VQNNGTRILLIVIDLLIGVIVSLCAAFLTWKMARRLTRHRYQVVRHLRLRFCLRWPSSRHSVLSDSMTPSWSQIYASCF